MSPCNPLFFLVCVLLIKHLVYETIVTHLGESVRASGKTFYIRYLYLFKVFLENSFAFSDIGGTFNEKFRCERFTQSARNAIWISSSLSSLHFRQTLDLVFFGFVSFGGLNGSGNSGQQSLVFTSIIISLQKARPVLGQ